VRGILVNEIYAGRTYYGKTRMIKKSEFQRHGKRTKMDYKDWIPIDAPELAIVERDIFEAVQDRARRNQERAKRNQKREYLMTGHFRCGACNSAMAGSASRPNGYITIYYRCGNHWRSIKNEACPNMNKTVIRDKVDNAVWNWLADLLKDDQAIMDGIRDMRERSEVETEPKQRRIEQIDSLIDKRRTAIERLVSELGEEENETIKEAVKTRVKLLGKEIESLTGERDSLAAELAQVQVSPELEAEVLRIAAELREELDAPDFETKRYLLDKLNVQVVFQANDTGRWLDVKCGIIPDWESIMLHPSSASFLR
jgi:site-specific DNA recombinase